VVALCLLGDEFEAKPAKLLADVEFFLQRLVLQHLWSQVLK
jgi:hypothetical protein